MSTIQLEKLVGIVGQCPTFGMKDQDSIDSHCTVHSRYFERPSFRPLNDVIDFMSLESQSFTIVSKRVEVDVQSFLILEKHSQILEREGQRKGNEREDERVKESKAMKKKPKEKKM